MNNNATNMSSALLTDLYMLSVANALFRSKQSQAQAVFYLFTRRAPFGGDYTLVAGLENLIHYLQQWHFKTEDITYLQTLCFPNGEKRFDDNFLAHLESLRFSGCLDAMPEGSVVFANEPILRIQAPLLMGQMLESIVINAINFPSLIATKAARIKQAAGEQLVAEFGMRRAQGLQASLMASRAAYIGGVDAVSNILAGEKYHIPLVGTISHSFILSFEDEIAAFDAVADYMGDQTVLLVDTYNTEQGVTHAIKTAKARMDQGKMLDAIRLDSGDLCALSQMARQMLDDAGLAHVAIIASGDLDEYQITRLKQAGACIDRWGVGTRLVTAYDQPALDITYKLAAIQDTQQQWQYRMKFSDTPAKQSLPGLLQIRRYYQQQRAHHDVIYDKLQPLNDELPAGTDQSEDLLQTMIKDGSTIYDCPAVDDIRRFSLKQQASIDTSTYRVDIDPAISQMQRRLSED